jgi:menaquinone-dependent protoporphyrinogen IX oxidase
MNDLFFGIFIGILLVFEPLFWFRKTIVKFIIKKYGQRKNNPND